MESSVNKTDNQSGNFLFKERIFEEVEGGYYDDAGFYNTPNGSFWDPEGYYFNKNGYDRHGGYYDEEGNYFPGEGWNEEKQAYEGELEFENLLCEDDEDDLEEVDDFDGVIAEDFNFQNIENFQSEEFDEPYESSEQYVTKHFKGNKRSQLDKNIYDLEFEELEFLKKLKNNDVEIVQTVIKNNENKNKPANKQYSSEKLITKKHKNLNFNEDKIVIDNFNQEGENTKVINSEFNTSDKLKLNGKCSDNNKKSNLIQRNDIILMNFEDLDNNNDKFKSNHKPDREEKNNNKKNYNNNGGKNYKNKKNNQENKYVNYNNF